MPSSYNELKFLPFIFRGKYYVLGDGKPGLRSRENFIVSRPFITTGRTKQIGNALNFILNGDHCLGPGQFPTPSPFTVAVSVIGRLECPTSYNDTGVDEFMQFSKKFADIFIADFASTPTPPVLELLPNYENLCKYCGHIPEKRRLEMWKNHLLDKQGIAPSRYKRGGIFNKLENSAKGPGTLKPRAIVPSSDKNFIRGFLVLPVLKRLSVILKDKLIKGDDAEKLSRKVFATSVREFCSTDYSGYENALCTRMREVERLVFCGCCRAWGLHDTADFLWEYLKAERPVKTQDFEFWIAVRCSGDFWTSMGNCIINLCIVFYCHWVHCGRGDIEELVRELLQEPIIVEGDDCLLPKSIFHPEVAETLQLKFSALSHGLKHGDCDFLKMTYYPVWHDGVFVGKLGNTLRMVMSLCWTRGCTKNAKTLYLWRLKARSLLEMVPGHPIIFPLVMRIGQLTSGITAFKGWRQLSQTYWFNCQDIDGSTNFEKVAKVKTVCPELRALLATHDCAEFCRVPIEQQIWWENFLPTWNGLDMLPMVPAWSESPDFEPFNRGICRAQMDDFCSFPNPIAEGLYTLANRLELPPGSVRIPGKVSHSGIEFSHDWKKTARIGEASHPGPTSLPTGAGIAPWKILVIFLIGAISVARSQVGVLLTMVLTLPLTSVITPLAKGDCIRGDWCYGSTSRPRGVPANFETASAFSGSLRVTSPSVADAGMQGLPTSRTEGSGHGFQFPKQQKHKQGSRKPNKSAQPRAPGRSQTSQTLMNTVKPLIKAALRSASAASVSKLSQMNLLSPAVAKTIGAKISKLVGSGDYTVTDAPSVNSLFPKSSSGNAYAQFSNGAQSTRITHREYIKDINTSTVTAGVFNIEGIEINPGLSFNFPYLASIAQNFEEYRVRGMVFEFISSCSSYAPGTAMGTTVMSMEYNAAAPIFTNKQQMENSDFAISARFDKNMMYGVECASNVQNSYYVRSGASSLPVTTTDLGVLYIATQPSATLGLGLTLGELWVSYDIEFIRPRITPARFGYCDRSLSSVAGGALRIDSVKNVVYASLTGIAYANPSLTTIVATFTNASLGDTYLFYGTGVESGGGIWSGTMGMALVGLTAPGVLVGGATGTTTANNTLFTNVIFLTVTSVSVPPTVTFTMPTGTTAGTGNFIFTNLGNGFTADTL